MSRLIDADKLPEHKFTRESAKGSDYMRGWNDAIDAIIDNAPTVELEPFCKVTLDEDKLREIVDELRQEIIDGEIVLTEKKKTGHWNYARFGNQTLVKCSECEEEFLGNDVSDYNFCPNCGADMRGGRE